MWQSIVHGCPYLCFCCSDLGRELVNNVQCSGRPSRACPASAFCCLLLGTVHCLCSVCRHLHAGGFSMPVCHLPRPGVSSNILKRGLHVGVSLVQPTNPAGDEHWPSSIRMCWVHYCGVVDSSLISRWGSSCGCWSLCACIVLGHCPGFGECNTVHALHVTYDFFYE